MDSLCLVETNMFKPKPLLNVYMFVVSWYIHTYVLVRWSYLCIVCHMHMCLFGGGICVYVTCVSACVADVIVYMSHAHMLVWWRYLCIFHIHMCLFGGGICAYDSEKMSQRSISSMWFNLSWIVAGHNLTDKFSWLQNSCSSNDIIYLRYSANSILV